MMVKHDIASLSMLQKYLLKLTHLILFTLFLVLPLTFIDAMILMSLALSSIHEVIGILGGREVV